MSDHNRRDILQQVGTVAFGLSSGFKIIPVGAAEAELDDDGPETHDLVIANNSTDTRQIRIGISPPDNRDENIYSRKFELPGLNNDQLSDKTNAQFHGSISARGNTKQYRVSAKLPDGPSDEIRMPITPYGLPDACTIAVYVEPDGDITTLGSWG